MNWDYAQHISALPPESRSHFYELFAYNLTISTRSVWSDEKLSDAEKVERMKRLNEIQHRVTARIHSIRLNQDHWTEGDFAKMYEQWARECPGLLGHIGWAIKTSYRATTGQDA